MMETIWSRALNLLRRQGWRQGPYDRADLRVCLTEALSYSSTGNLTFIKEVADHLGLVYGGPGQGNRRGSGGGLGDARPVVQWNDAPERTFAQVERLLTELHEKELAERGLLHGSGS